MKRLRYEVDEILMWVLERANQRLMSLGLEAQGGIYILTVFNPLLFAVLLVLFVVSFSFVKETCHRFKWSTRHKKVPRKKSDLKRRQKKFPK